MRRRRRKKRLVANRGGKFCVCIPSPFFFCVKMPAYTLCVCSDTRPLFSFKRTQRLLVPRLIPFLLLYTMPACSTVSLPCPEKKSPAFILEARPLPSPILMTSRMGQRVKGKKEREEGKGLQKREGDGRVIYSTSPILFLPAAALFTFVIKVSPRKKSRGPIKASFITRRP